MVIEGKLLQDMGHKDLREMRVQIEEAYGSLRKAIVLFSARVDTRVIDQIMSEGFTVLVVPGDLDVYLTLEVSELAFSGDFDTVVIGYSGHGMDAVLNKVRSMKEVVFVCKTQEEAEKMKIIADGTLIIEEDEE